MMYFVLFITNIYILSVLAECFSRNTSFVISQFYNVYVEVDKSRYDKKKTWTNCNNIDLCNNSSYQ